MPHSQQFLPNPSFTGVRLFYLFLYPLPLISPKHYSQYISYISSSILVSASQRIQLTNTPHYHIYPHPPVFILILSFFMTAIMGEIAILPWKANSPSWARNLIHSHILKMLLQKVSFVSAVLIALFIGSYPLACM